MKIMKRLHEDHEGAPHYLMNAHGSGHHPPGGPAVRAEVPPSFNSHGIFWIWPSQAFRNTRQQVSKLLAALGADEIVVVLRAGVHPLAQLDILQGGGPPCTKARDNETELVSRKRDSDTFV